MDEFTELAEVLAELRELKRRVADLQRDVADLSRKLSEIKTGTPEHLLKEGVARLNAVAEAILENASLIRATLAEERLRRDETCMVLLERLAALREVLEKHV
ncbi:MAG: hypothetical protein ACK4M3_05595 [Pyrobaculum sp.]